MGREANPKATRQGSGSFLVFRRRDSQAFDPQLSLFRHGQNPVQLKFSCSVLQADNQRHRGNSVDAGGSTAERDGWRTVDRAMEPEASRSCRQPFRKLFPFSPRHRHHVVLFERRQHSRGDAFGIVQQHKALGRCWPRLPRVNPTEGDLLGVIAARVFMTFKRRSGDGLDFGMRKS